MSDTTRFDFDRALALGRGIHSAKKEAEAALRKIIQRLQSMKRKAR